MGQFLLLCVMGFKMFCLNQFIDIKIDSFKEKKYLLEKHDTIYINQAEAVTDSWPVMNLNRFHQV